MLNERFNPAFFRPSFDFRRRMLEEIAPADTTKVFPRTCNFLPFLKVHSNDDIVSPRLFNSVASHPAMISRLSFPCFSCIPGRIDTSIESFLLYPHPMLQYPHS